MQTCTQKYELLNPTKRPLLEGLLAVKRSGLYEVVKMVQTAAQEFRSEDISNGDEEGMDYSYLFELDINDEQESDVDDDDVDVMS